MDELNSNYAIDPTKKHLGGNYIGGDPATFCPTVWDYIIKKYSIQSVLDVGSGRGYAAKWFSDQGLQVTAIEGLHDNVVNALHPTIEHDLTIEPFIKNTNLINCIEVVEHIEEQYLDNLLGTLCAGDYLFITHAIPGQDGWHHVNCQPQEYWINHLQSRNFKFCEEETMILRKLAKQDKAKHISRHGLFFKNENK
jgi:hypothetical protein